MADADAQAKMKLAQGEKAIQVVPVQVSAEQVEVNRKQMEVDKSTAEFKQQFEKSAIEFELGKLEIQAKERHPDCNGTVLSVTSRKRVTTPSTERLRRCPI